MSGITDDAISQLRAILGDGVPEARLRELLRDNSGDVARAVDHHFHATRGGPSRMTQQEDHANSDPLLMLRVLGIRAPKAKLRRLLRESGGNVQAAADRYFSGLEGPQSLQGSDGDDAAENDSDGTASLDATSGGGRRAVVEAQARRSGPVLALARELTRARCRLPSALAQLIGRANRLISPCKATLAFALLLTCGCAQRLSYRRPPMTITLTTKAQAVVRWSEDGRDQACHPRRGG
jgi:hypothetical protein